MADVHNSHANNKHSVDGAGDLLLQLHARVTELEAEVAILRNKIELKHIESLES